MRPMRAVSRSVTVAAPPQRVFELLADPRAHRAFDGSGTVQGVVAGPDRLYLGARFRVRMRKGVPYTVRNRVVEFDENRRIAWRHVGRHRWRYDVEPSAGGTLVTETFDYSNVPWAWLYERLRLPEANAKGIEATLARLRALLGTPPAEPTSSS